MNRLLGMLLGVLLLVSIYYWFINGKMKETPVDFIQDLMKIPHLDKDGNMQIQLQVEMIKPTQELREPQTSDMDVGEATYGQIQIPGPSVEYPMENDMGYPSGILPGKVGTFHPTKDCDRFLCNGCDLNGGCATTDDSGRNYPELIDRIRASRTNEYPFYQMN